MQKRKDFIKIRIYNIKNPLFVNRSSAAMSGKEIPDDGLMWLFEAARSALSFYDNHA